MAMDTSAGAAIAEKPVQRARAASLTITLTMPHPLTTANWRNKHHWRERSRVVAVQREEAKLATYAAMGEHRATLRGPDVFAGAVTVDLAIAPHPKQVRPDDSAVWEGMKPVIDGICSALGVDDARFEHGRMTWDKDDRSGLLVVTLTARRDAGC